MLEMTDIVSYGKSDAMVEYSFSFNMKLDGEDLLLIEDALEIMEKEIGKREMSAYEIESHGFGPGPREMFMTVKRPTTLEIMEASFERR